jgi:hypothetical protein
LFAAAGVASTESHSEAPSGLARFLQAKQAAAGDATATHLSTRYTSCWLNLCLAAMQTLSQLTMNMEDQHASSTTNSYSNMSQH